MDTERPTLLRPQEGNTDAWSAAEEFECVLSVDVQLPGFTVRDFLMLDKGAFVDTHWNYMTDVPLNANGELLAWAHFEVVGERLAVRLTELA